MGKKVPFSKEDYYEMLDSMPLPSAQQGQSPIDRLKAAVQKGLGIKSTAAKEG